MPDLIRLYRALYRIRRIEEEIARIYPSDKIKSPVHLSIGQEFIAVGVCDLLGADDMAFGTYRSHALYLARGGDLKRMMAELFGKVDGCTRGKGGSMHLMDLDAGVMATSAIVASSIPNAAGYALGRRVQGLPGVTVCFHGDGASEEGIFYESLQFARLKSLPVLYVCENNGYAIHSPLRNRSHSGQVQSRISGLGIASEYIADGNLLSVRAATQRALHAIRQGHGPRFLEVAAYRWKQHVGPDDDWSMGYRDQSEIEPWLTSDPVRVLADQVPDAVRERIHQEVQHEIEEAFAYAEASPFPPDEELHQHVHAR